MGMRLYGAVFVLAGIFMLVVTVIQWLKQRSFRNCEAVTATVTDVEKRSHYANGHSSTTYSQKVSYTVDGVAYKGSLPCDGADYQLGTNREIEIRYKSSNPKKIISNDIEKLQRGQKILWIITLALFVIGAALFFLPSVLG